MAPESNQCGGVANTPHPRRLSPEALRVRAMAAGDMEAVTGLRLALLRETDPAAAGDHSLQVLRPATLALFRRSLESSDWQTWVAEAPGGPAPIAVGTMALWQRPPYPGNLAGLDTYLLNMYTVPAFRHRGAARGIANAALAWARQRGAPKVVLHATADGRALYRSLGFVGSTAYMELQLAGQD